MTGPNFSLTLRSTIFIAGFFLFATHCWAVGSFTNRILYQSTAGANNEAGDRFGFAIVTGDFNNDGFSDLASGTPFEDDGAVDNGLVIVSYGGPEGIGSRGYERFTQRSVITATNEDGDRFGQSLAVGDFDGDQIDDLAIGSPYEDIGDAVDTGVVAVLFGSSTGLLPSRSESFTQNSVSSATNESGDRFGYSLAAGNFNGDGFDDLAIGAPGEDIGSAQATGLVAIMFGSSEGLLPSSTESFTQNSVVSATNEDGDRFGYSLAVGNFDGDDFDDLAIGAPFEDTGGFTDTGLVAVMFGSSEGLLPSRSESMTQSLVAFATNEDGDRFGFRITTGNFDGDNFDDLAIGTPYEDRGGAQNSGIVYIMYGSSAGLLPSRTENVHQSTAYATDGNNDLFGYSLVVADFDRDGWDDLVVGTPRDNVANRVRNGAIMTFFGSSDGVRPARSNWLRQKWFGGREENNDRFGHALAAADFDRDGLPELSVGVPFEDVRSISNSGAVFTSSIEPALPELRSAQAAIVIDTASGAVRGVKLADERRAMASTTKMMTALLTIEAINAGTIALTDTVTISSNSPAVGGSGINLSTGDTIQVVDLLRGLMLSSGNDAAVALAEYIANTESNFVRRMNQRATRLGLSNTNFVNAHGRDPEDTNPSQCDGDEFNKPACAHYSTPRDLATLARFALNDPLFATVVSTSAWTTSTWMDREGTDRNSRFCNTNRLVRRGNGGCRRLPEFNRAAYGVKTGTTDRAGSCLVAAAQVGGEDVIAVIMGAANNRDRYTDIATVLDYGLANPSGIQSILTDTQR